jgi:DNA invertase Pin-like site-specific DNA recombinase
MQLRMRRFGVRNCSVAGPHFALNTGRAANIAAGSPTAFVDDTPTATFVRQVLSAVAQLDKAMTVAKLRGARDHKRRQAGWCEGGTPLHERYPEAVRMAKRLYRANPVTGKRRSLRKIAKELAGAGHLNTAGAPSPNWVAAVVRSS